MASCITGQVGNSYCPQIKLEVTVDSSYASNDTKAKLDWKLQYVAHGYAVSTSNSKSYTAVINGTTVASGSYAIGGKTSTNTIATGSVYIDRGTASKSISFSCSMHRALLHFLRNAHTHTVRDTLASAYFLHKIRIERVPAPLVCSF